MKCPKCGKKLNSDSKWCFYCGSKVDHDENDFSDKAKVISEKFKQINSDTVSLDESTRKKLIWSAIIFVIVLIVILSTGKHWTKVDVEAYDDPTYKIPTGEFNVTKSSTDNCYIGQDWTNCINVKVDQYNAACANRRLTFWGKSVCDNYLNEINRMKSLDRSGYYVASLGGYGNLSVTETYKTVGGEHHDAVTHEAVCYLGFIGECE